MCSAHQVSQLTEAIRYSRISPTYLAIAVSLAPLLNLTLPQLLDLSQFRTLTSTQSTLYCKNANSACPPGWFKPQRPLSPSGNKNKVNLCLVISTAQLGLHLSRVQKMNEGGPEPLQLFTAVNFRGLNIRLTFSSFRLKPNDVNFRVDVRVCAKLPACTNLADPQLGVLFSSKVSIHSKVPGCPLYTISEPARFGWLGMKNGLGWGWNRFPQVASRFPGDPMLLTWWDPFVMDGSIKLTAEVTDERTG